MIDSNLKRVQLTLMKFCIWVIPVKKFVTGITYSITYSITYFFHFDALRKFYKNKIFFFILNEMVLRGLINLLWVHIELFFARFRNNFIPISLEVWTKCILARLYEKVLSRRINLLCSITRKANFLVYKKLRNENNIFSLA